MKLSLRSELVAIKIAWCWNLQWRMDWRRAFAEYVKLVEYVGHAGAIDS